jgi:hypothetical protein
MYSRHTCTSMAGSTGAGTGAADAGYVSQAFNTTSSLIQQSWDAVMDQMSLEAIGGCIYETLFEV